LARAIAEDIAANVNSEAASHMENHVVT
jgi:hypothetical protein